MQLEFDQQSVELRKSLAHTEALARQDRERLEADLETLRDSHAREVRHSETVTCACFETDCAKYLLLELERFGTE